MTEEVVPVRSGALAQLKRYAALGYGALGTILSLGLMVLGALLVGLAISVILAGFQLVDASQDLSTAAMLVSSLVLAVVGLFCLGVAAEGPLGRGRRLVGFKLWEVAIGRTFAVVGVGFGALLASGFITQFLDGIPEPLHQGTEGLRSVGLAGMIAMPIIGVPLSLLVRWAPTRYEWVPKADIPVMFVVWAIATMMIVS